MWENWGGRGVLYSSCKTLGQERIELLWWGLSRGNGLFHLIGRGVAYVAWWEG